MLLPHTDSDKKNFRRGSILLSSIFFLAYITVIIAASLLYLRSNSEFHKTDTESRIKNEESLGGVFVAYTNICHLYEKSVNSSCTKKEFENFWCDKRKMKENWLKELQNQKYVKDGRYIFNVEICDKRQEKRTKIIDGSIYFTLSVSNREGKYTYHMAVIKIENPYREYTKKYFERNIESRLEEAGKKDEMEKIEKIEKEENKDDYYNENGGDEEKTDGERVEHTDVKADSKREEYNDVRFDDETMKGNDGKIDVDKEKIEIDEEKIEVDEEKIKKDVMEEHVKYIEGIRERLLKAENVRKNVVVYSVTGER